MSTFCDSTNEKARLSECYVFFKICVCAKTVLTPTWRALVYMYAMLSDMSMQKGGQVHAWTSPLHWIKKRPVCTCRTIKQISEYTIDRKKEGCFVYQLRLKNDENVT